MTRLDHLGVTGTRHQCTRAQARAFDDFLRSSYYTTVHHGACTGADAMCHYLALNAHRDVIVHPPNIGTYLADFLPRNCHVEWLEPEPYRVRNQAIVDASAALVAFPQYPEDHPVSQSSGTWMTIRMARAKGIPVAFILGGGTLLWERREDTEGAATSQV